MGETEMEVMEVKEPPLGRPSVVVAVDGVVVIAVCVLHDFPIFLIFNNALASSTSRSVTPP